MIRLISGTVASITPLGVVIDLGNIGYLVRTLKKTHGIVGDMMTLHTHLAVRENALDLYGFINPLELECFELLLGIPKIGPKSALQILEQATVMQILEAVNLDSPTHLRAQTGISKKTAEKIVSELKGKVAALSLPTIATDTPVARDITKSYQEAFSTLLAYGYNPEYVRRALSEPEPHLSASELVIGAFTKLTYFDAFDTLLTLGYNTTDVRRVLDDQDPNEPTTTLVNRALKQLT